MKLLENLRWRTGTVREVFAKAAVPAGEVVVGDRGARAAEKDEGPPKALFGFEMMDEPVKVLGEVASENEEEKDRWRGIEMERGPPGEGWPLESVVGPEGSIVEKFVWIEEVVLARW